MIKLEERIEKLELSVNDLQDQIKQLELRAKGLLGMVLAGWALAVIAIVYAIRL